MIFNSLTVKNININSPYLTAWQRARTKDENYFVV